MCEGTRLVTDRTTRGSRLLFQLPADLTWRQYTYGLCYFLIIVGAWYRID